MEKTKTYKNEAQLQQDCVIWFKNNHLNLKKRLFAVMNEGKNATEKLGLGMTPGVPDLLFYSENERLYGFELKLPGTSHKVEHLRTQAMWLLDVLPGRSWFVDSIDTFKALISGDVNTPGAIDPAAVLAVCNETTSKTIVWDKEAFQNVR
jgi:hypothetical protein